MADGLRCTSLPLPASLVPRDFAACVKRISEELSSPAAVTFSLTLRECGLRASSCGALRTCALRGARADVCTGRGKNGSVDMCDGDGRAITCKDERVTLVRDCPRGGEQCVVRDGQAQCALGSCEKDYAPTCSASGTRVLECKKGKLLSLDCNAFALRCTTSGGQPHCATTGASCTDGSTRCDGGVAVDCHHGHEVRVDCAQGGLACGGSGATIGACTSAASASDACDPATAPRCDGATLKWCAWGKSRSYLCKSKGLSKCVAEDKGSRCTG